MPYLLGVFRKHIAHRQRDWTLATVVHHAPVDVRLRQLATHTVKHISDRLWYRYQTR